MRKINDLCEPYAQIHSTLQFDSVLPPKGIYGYPCPEYLTYVLIRGKIIVGSQDVEWWCSGG